MKWYIITSQGLYVHAVYGEKLKDMADARRDEMNKGNARFWVECVEGNRPQVGEQLPTP